MRCSNEETLNKYPEPSVLNLVYPANPLLKAQKEEDDDDDDTKGFSMDREEDKPPYCEQTVVYKNQYLSSEPGVQSYLSGAKYNILPKEDSATAEAKERERVDKADAMGSFNACVGYCMTHASNVLSMLRQGMSKCATTGEYHTRCRSEFLQGNAPLNDFWLGPAEDIFELRGRTDLGSYVDESKIEDKQDEDGDYTLYGAPPDCDAVLEHEVEKCWDGTSDYWIVHPEIRNDTDLGKRYCVHWVKNKIAGSYGCKDDKQDKKCKEQTAPRTEKEKESDKGDKCAKQRQFEKEVKKWSPDNRE
jgi:hypothetical protein